MGEINKRKWKRLKLSVPAKVTVGETTQTAELNDLSAGGVSVSGQISNDDDDDVEISLDDFGVFTGPVVREWDDGIAVEFDLNDDGPILA